MKHNDWEHTSWSLELRHFINPRTTAYLAIDNASKQGGFNNLIPGLLAVEPLFPQFGDAARAMLEFGEEASTAFEIGVKGAALDSRLNYSLAVFYQTFDDHQITQPGGVQALMTPLGDLNALFANQLINAEEVLTRGVELELFYLFGERWDMSLRASYFDATVEE
ncbi:MAG: TonB-dependent receptor [Halioglobus sp.]|nr:TonB-dependent receptor [Halioglobus sp.]